MPEKWKLISVWMQVRVTLPLAGVSTGKVETRAIYAQPSMRKDQLPCFDTVLVNLCNDNPDPQVGLSSEWLPSKAKNKKYLSHYVNKNVGNTFEIDFWSIK